MTNIPALLLQPAQSLPKSPPSPDFWMPRSTSVTTQHVDWIWDFMLWVSFASMVGIMGAMIYFCVKYRAKSRKANEYADPSTDHNTTLEITWSVIPLFVVIALFVWGFKGYVELRTPPQGAVEVRATGQKWKWLFEYPHGSEDVLHVPVNTPVRVVINAVDVLHSLYIPNFRVKMDAVPGRYTDLWFEATEPGEYPIFCAEYCGTSHSDMLSRVVVHEKDDYAKWLKKATEVDMTIPPAERGKRLADKQGCLVCHSSDGSPKVGPTWKGLFGKSEPTSVGSVNVDENYLRESIVDPQAKIVTGFAPSMPTYQGKLSDQQLGDLIEYIKSLK